MLSQIPKYKEKYIYNIKEKDTKNPSPTPLQEIHQQRDV